MKIKSFAFAFSLAAALMLSSCGGRQAASANQNPTEAVAPEKKPEKSFKEFENDLFVESMEASPFGLHFRIKHPENFGIEVPEPGFGHYSYDIIRKDIANDKEILKIARSYDDNDLTEEEKLTRRMIVDYYEYGSIPEELIYFSQPLVPGTGVQSQRPIILSEYEFKDKKDIEDYFAFLRSFEGYLDDIGEFEKERADKGYPLADGVLERIDESLQDYLIRPDNSILTDSFVERLEKVPELTDKEKEAYIKENHDILVENFIPAYTRLSETVNELKGRKTEGGGLADYPGGRDYFEYLVKSESGTDSDIKELKSRIAERVNRDLAGISDIADANPNSYTNMKLSPIYDASPEKILEKLGETIKGVYPELPNLDFTVNHVPEALETALNPAFYIIPAIDEEDTHTIFINDSKVGNGNMLTTLAHEGYPGHMYQYSYLHSKNIPPIRYMLECDGFAEGWGMFAEIYSWLLDLGLDEDTASLMYYNDSASYGLYALLDISINYEGWDMEQTQKFLEENYGITEKEVAEEVFYDIVGAPGNNVKYYTGYLEISDMYERYIMEQGAKADSCEFFEFLLGETGASFRIIKEDFEKWMFGLKLRIH